MAMEFISHRDEAIDEKNKAIEKALEKIGLIAERYAKELCVVDTGRLRNSISHQVEGKTVYVGTNVEYAPYIEFGTGVYAEKGGRTVPWSYEDDKGEWHTTIGSKPHPYLRPAIDNHMSEYKKIVENELKS